MPSFRIKEIWRYPVKGLAGEKCENINLSSAGLPLDRHWRLIDGKTGDRLRTKETEPALYILARGIDTATQPLAELYFPDGRVIPTDTPEINNALSDHFERPVRLEAAASGQPYWYEAPVNILTEASLRYLAEFATDSELNPRRFRPNLLIADDQNQIGLVENDWVDSTISIGSVKLSGQKECERCIITTRAQPGLPRDPRVLQHMTRETGKNLALQTTIAKEGTISVGDLLTITKSDFAAHDES